ncbi:uncharacterized protein LOC132759657 isoform X2 [Ruditapes philippinarum]|uniref:uncharacterized protein LOC132759657 isoform X2 n=1 Tax=Ruditapes philippinarum TaxID=129788 RepID=UPI00295C1831|nr:uncharacterized protein LOC132759657 isoform X2 [Ruditapes philippinarum]
MKWAYRQTLHILSTVLCFVSLSEQSSTCPPNPHEKVQQCTDNVLPNLNKQSHTTETDRSKIQHAKETCKDSRLPEVADCIQDILDRCRGTTDAEQTLQRLIDKDKVVSTVDYFCRHMEVYEEQAVCISQYHGETANCSKYAHDNFKAKLTAGANMDVLIMGTCRFHSVARSCLTNTTQRHCGSSAATFVYTLLTGLIPPFCETMNPEYTNVQTTRGFNNERKQSVESSAAHCHSSLYVLFVFIFMQFFK